ncbi:hypothetical protein SAMN05216178_6769 [Pseudomonas saponiphila]|jgi:hypothetical protein|uniref:Uncharacterized protein n=1 Tax=Pseudomonas saponiphila TaxID=556534 RepID=A0A1H4ZP95_9PSED|nr:hypothetical protein [Pseudomonas saponiphila]SED32026.1 hypothetical protein SAMN05216178_6769 [Pseudomonas saponiphila]
MNSNSDKEISFQPRVADWLNDCFGQEIAADVIERNHRFLEEALELVQACNCSADEAHKLVDYVFGRDVGDKPQEVGGVLVTLAALCAAQGVDMHQAGEVELARISQPETVVRIREKQKRKPAMSPLPGSYPDRESMSQPSTLRYVVAKTIGGYTRGSKDEIEVIGVYDDEEVAAKVRLISSAQIFEVEMNTLAAGLLANAGQLFGSDSIGFQLMASKLTAK